MTLAVPKLSRYPILSSKDPKLAARNKTLSESLAVDPAWMNGKFFKKYLAEAILDGNISDETPSVAATLQILDQILMGVEAHIPLDFARVYDTDKAVLQVPIGTYAEAAEISGGSFTNLPKTTANITVNLDKEYGVTVTWTRAHLEDATWSVMSEQNEGAGYAIQKKLCALLVTEIRGAGGATHVGVIADYTSWTNWTEFLGAVDVAKYGPADFCLVSPVHYWGLLAMDQIVNSLYACSDEVMRSGVMKTTYGMTFLKVDDMTTPVVLNSKKAIALAYRRHITVEPYEHPELDEYGFVAHVRAKVGMLNVLGAGEAT